MDYEHQQQVLLFSWAYLKETQIEELCSLYAVPNAGAGSQKGQAGKMKAEGVKAGVPDVCLPVVRVWPRSSVEVTEHSLLCADGVIYGGLYIEMKSPDAYPRPNQRAWADRLEKQGMKVIRRCTSWQEAARHILEYLGIEVTRKRFPELFVT